METEDESAALSDTQRVAVERFMRRYRQAPESQTAKILEFYTHNPKALPSPVPGPDLTALRKVLDDLDPDEE